VGELGKLDVSVAPSQSKASRGVCKVRYIAFGDGEEECGRNTTKKQPNKGRYEEQQQQRSNLR
jgi:hypothetical protein